MGRFDGIVDVNDERLQGFTLDARKMIVAAELQKQQEPIPTTYMSPENAEGWKTWLDSHLTKFNNEVVIQHFDDYHEQVVKEFDLVVKELRDEIKALRAEMQGEITRAISKSANRLIIFDSSDPQARKHLKDDPEKILDWSEMRKRV
jgi:hypothetical protein